ncbi:hypothetical protein ACS0TY_035463 [Phlomoides rotata]
MTKGTIDEMHTLYYNHAREMGFSVRKGTSRFSRDETLIVLGKLFLCACAGIRVSTKENCSKQKRNVALTRTNCKAMMRIKRNNDGVYEVVKHIEKHNDPLTRTEWSHLHRSERSITDEKAIAIEEMINQDEEEDGFFFRVKMDDDGRLSNLFWRDSMMREDYEIYGDVMVFDTTYRTNRFGELKCDSPFKAAFTKCLSGCNDEKEFEECWKAMISSYNLENNTPSVHQIYATFIFWK